MAIRKRGNGWQIDPLEIDPPADTIEGKERLRRKKGADKIAEAFGSALVWGLYILAAWVLLDFLAHLVKAIYRLGS